MLYFNLSSDIIKDGTDSKYDMSFSKLNSHLDSKFLKIYTPHVSMVLLTANLQLLLLVFSQKQRE